MTDEDIKIGPRRWTLHGGKWAGCGSDRVYRMPSIKPSDIALGDAVEVMPVSEHEALMSEAYSALATGEHEYEALLDAARALADAVAATSAWYLQPVRRRCEELCAVLGAARCGAAEDRR